MTASDKDFAGSIPALYDRYLGPLLFEPYAADLAERIKRLAPSNILEIAAGTGIVTRALAARLPKTPIVATDLNQPMIDRAAAQVKAPRITWRQADAQALPFDDSSFDAVVCQFGVMFFPDKGKAFAEARRVLEHGGHYAFSVWDRISENEIADIVTGAVARLFPKDPPQFLARTPYGYHDLDAIRDALQHVGFTHVATETIAKRSRAASARDAAIGYCQGTPLRNEIETRDKTLLEPATEAAAAAIAARFGRGAIDAGIQAHVITASR